MPYCKRKVRVSLQIIMSGDESFSKTNLAINRTVRKLEPIDQDLSAPDLLPFLQYFEVPNVILLGDPGSGKTYSFTAAAVEEKATYLTVRQFLVVENAEYGGTVYLDGLDEFRSRTDDKNSVAEVIKLLNRLKRPRLRLSCRAADWLGETDLSLFRTYFRGDPFVVLGLQPLNKEEAGIILRTKGIENSDDFVHEAENHGLEGLLGNPQTLIMLAEVVGLGRWPNTKLELYEKSVQLLLSEHNRERSRAGLGQYGPEELIAPAGAACASILVSGVAGVNLLANDSTRDFPSYRSVPFDDLNQLLSSLTRRAFSGSEGETVSYVHRTVAEFLAAKWLSDQVRNGLPIRRVQSLIGIEGRPASELRGLHAWLAVLLPEYASILMANDPYGVLMYADAASLSPSDRQSLFRALEVLSKTDPWFRADNWSDSPLGALSGPDMVDSFRRSLSDPISGFHLRSLVLDAIRNGPTLPDMRTDLCGILANSEATYAERLDAMDALLRVVPGGESEVAEVYRAKLSREPSSARLRAEVLTRIYPSQFGPDDVVSIFRDYQEDKERGAIGELRRIDSSIPDKDLPYIMDQLSGLLHGRNAGGNRVNDYELEAVFFAMLSRIMMSSTHHKPARLWRWLKTLQGGRLQYSTAHKGRTYDWLSQNQAAVLEMFDIAYDELDMEKDKWDFLRDFQEATMQSVNDEVLARHVLAMLRHKETLSAKDVFLYELCGLLAFRSRPQSNELFEDFFRFAESRNELMKVRDTVCQCPITDWRVESSLRKIKYEREQLERKEQSRAYLKQTSEQIRSGEHLHNLGLLAVVYLGLHDNNNAKLSPIERLRREVGEEFVAIALEGFSTVIRRSDLPTPVDVGSSSSVGSHPWWWYAILLGMDEEWRKEKSLIGLPDRLLESAVAIAMEVRTPGRDGVMIRGTDREWCQSIFFKRPDIVQIVFEDMARAGLKAKGTHIEILSSLLHIEQTKSWRSELALKLIADFPLASPENLRNMTLATIWEPEYHRELVDLARFLLGAHTCAKEEQRAIWLVIGFLLDYDVLRLPFVAFAKSHKWVVWTLRDIIARARVSGEANGIQLSVDQLETIIGLFGEQFENVYQPKDGWSGNQNAWDASELIRKTIDALSALPDLEASNALKRLLRNSGLSSYHDNLKHAIVTQAAIRREREYRQPSWIEVTKALRGGAPANTADLHALILDHLATLKSEIRHSNTDVYKAFWRCDSRGHVDEPEIEDICRDRLVDLMKPRLLPLGLRVEPEGHMVEDKRADIVVLPPPGQKLPLELKRDVHGDLWGACENQLERLYARDPEAEGYGIYVVFWFGSRRNGHIPAPPAGTRLPESAEEMELTLQSLIPNDKRYCLEAIVIDVTPPALP